ncbi:MAG TPA: cytochrome P460 family protein [Terriglobales bacterium]|nr:cytochrome P460 family protein [Terriglobales bacterium]
MKLALWWCVAMVLTAGALPAAAPDSADMPQFTKDNQLVRPENYREWIFLSAGLGMSYSPMNMNHEPLFTNVFVPRWAYRAFLASGKWPDKVMFVVEERNSTSKGSIVKEGHFQTDLEGIGVEVKDEARFPEKWAYFSFGENKTAGANPKQGCWECHENHAAVEHTFVQFYPTLKPVAQKFGTYNSQREQVEK